MKKKNSHKKKILKLQITIATNFFLKSKDWYYFFKNKMLFYKIRRKKIKTKKTKKTNTNKNFKFSIMIYLEYHYKKDFVLKKNLLFL